MIEPPGDSEYKTIFKEYKFILTDDFELEIPNRGTEIHVRNNGRRLLVNPQEIV